MWGIGFPELIVILVIALLVFGPGRLPEVGSFLGKSLRAFRDAVERRDDEDGGEQVEGSGSEKLPPGGNAA
ncbi:MAG TPA: twin-arginine translocase TatA/TatE family subunit [Candidatus Binatia bacterium]